MNLKDQLWIIKSRLLEKRNLLFMLVLFFVFIVIIISLTFYNCIKFINYSDIVKPNSRNIYIEIDNPSEESLKQINQITHVIFTISGQTYQIGFFNNKSSNHVYITPLIEKEEITLINGKNLKNKNDMLCPNNFYPYDFKDIIDTKNYLKGKEVLNKTVTINNEVFTIVGTYDAPKIRNTTYNCYISEKDFQKLITDHNNITIRVDKLENRNLVIQELKNMGYNNINTQYINFNNNLIYTGITIILIILFISFAIIYNFTKKKIRYHLNNYGILKASGYKNKQLFHIELLENLIIGTICFMISTISFIIVYNSIVTNINILNIAVYNSEITLEINYFYIFISYITILILIYIATKYLTHKYLNISINYMLKEE